MFKRRSSMGRSVATAVIAMLVLLAACAGGGRRSGEPHTSAAMVHGANIAYSVWRRDTNPSATPIVFIHGWASNQSVWDAQVEGNLPPELAKRRRITIDLPGHGRSDRPPGAYTMDSFVDAIAAVLDREQIQRAVLVGHSNGTPAIRQFYRRHPHRTSALVVVDGPLKSFFDDPAQAQAFVDKFLADTDDSYMRALVTRIIGEEVSQERSEKIRMMMMATPRDIRASAFEVAIDPAIWTNDPITVPMLMVNARQPAWDEAYLAYVRTLAPQMEYHELTGVSHFLMMDEPATFNRLLADFLAKNGL